MKYAVAGDRNPAEATGPEPTMKRFGSPPAAPTGAEQLRRQPMTVRIVQPADGTAYVSLRLGQRHRDPDRGQIIDVEPGWALETAIGAANLHRRPARSSLRPPTAGLARCQLKRRPVGLCRQAGGPAGPTGRCWHDRRSGGSLALSRYVVTATITVPAGTPATTVAGEPGNRRCGWLRQRQHQRGCGAVAETFIAGTTIVLDRGQRALHRPERQPAPVRAGPG